MKNTALVVIDIQNDITKNYREIVDNLNKAIDWAESKKIQVIYVCHNNVTSSAKNFLPGTKGAEIVPELRVVSDNIFTKTKANALTNEDLCAFIEVNGIRSFVVTGADATACVKSTCYNMTKAGYEVTVLSDCITSYDKKKLPAMLAYYESKNCRVETLEQIITAFAYETDGSTERK